MNRTIEIMDTTLRDGEQTSGMSFSSSEKLTIAKLLIEELNVDRIEIASARVSEGEFQAVTNITNWAKNTNEFTTRGLDSDQTVSAIKATEKMLNIIIN